MFESEEFSSVDLASESVQRLAEIYSPCFALVLQMRASSDYGSPDTVRSRIKGLLERAERQARRGGVPAEHVESAKFAVVAFIDETILSSDWAMKDVWLAKPLQLEFFDRFDAGEEFFERLEELRKDPGINAEMIETYFLCMALGFKGRYQFLEQEKLRSIIEDVHADLARLPGMRIKELSPNGLPRDQISAKVKSKLPTWAIIALTVAIAVVVYIAMRIYISNEAGDTRDSLDRLISVAKVEGVHNVSYSIESDVRWESS
ncbi:MAG: type IVB secretion system protein IcmH/DotU [Rhodothermia bacterium]|nr:type IVB secretion system protein IcmH/DotU [Rhodothermia bacterium]NNE35707.1 DotU family type IV/VI secretion system protein [Rhodothermales bacterium]